MNITLTERERIEERYHDERFKEGGDSLSRYSGGPHYEFFSQLVGDVRGLRVLDFGCGNGWYSIELAKKGADVWGIDISSELIKQANDLALTEAMGREVHFEKMSGENLTFPDSFFDLAVGSAILHHMDFRVAAQNIQRVLKAEGRAVFIEPLNQSIFLKAWRKLTPWRRSPVEKAFAYSDLVAFRAIFMRVQYHYFFLFSAITIAIHILLPTFSKSLYINALFEKFDSFLINKFPGLGKYCAVVVIEVRK